MRGLLIGLAALVVAPVAAAGPTSGAAPTPAEKGEPEAPPAPASDPARTGVGFSPLSFVYTAVQAGIGVSKHAEMEQTNDLLRSQGLDELPDLLSTVTFALTAAYPMGLVLEPMHRFNIVGTDQTTLTMHTLILNVGWLIHGRGDVVAYPFLGAGYGNSGLDISKDAPGRLYFNELLGNPNGEVLMSNSSFVLQTGLAATLWGSGHGDFLGLRFGAFWAPVSSGWKQRGHEVNGGPEPPMSGFYLTASLGFHDPRWR